MTALAFDTDFYNDEMIDGHDSDVEPNWHPFSQDPEGLRRYEEMIAHEDPTSGLEEIIDWDRLEAFIVGGILPSKQAVKSHILGEYAACGYDLSKKQYNDRIRQILAGMLPVYREIFRHLPNRSKTKGV